MIRTERVIGGVVAALALVVATGCTTYAPQNFFEGARLKAEFEAGNFRVVRTGVTASAAASYLFPFNWGGNLVGIALNDPAILEKATAKLQEKLKSDYQGHAAFLHNITREWTLERYILYGRQTITITADVVEFTGPYEDYRQRR